MTLPASGVIKMSDVKNELSIGYPITLAQSEVRTLFAKPSGAIKLTDGYGKSAVTYYAYRPTTHSTSGVTLTNPTNAYNTPGTPNNVDTSSYARYSPNYSTDIATFYGFTSGLSTGVLKISITPSAEYVQVYDPDFDYINTANAVVSVEYSVNNGSSYSSSFDSGQSGIIYGSVINGQGTNQVFVKTLPSNQDLSLVKVRIALNPGYEDISGKGTYAASGAAGCDIYDIMFLGTQITSPPPSITSFTASVNPITQGNSTTLYPVFTNGSGSINQSIGAVTSGVGYIVGPSSTITYTLTVTGSGTPATQDLTITVNAASALRPTSASYTGTTPTNPTYAYDGTAASVDTSTIATLTTSTNLTSTAIYSFAAGTKSGVLRVNMSSISTADNLSANEVNEAISNVSVEVSVNGTDYLGVGAGQSFDQISAWSSGDTGTNILLTKTLTNQNMANLKIRITNVSQRIGSGLSLATAAATSNRSDIVVY